MPSRGLQQLIERATSDEAFAARLEADPEGAMAEYGLTDEERAALRSRDAGWLRAAGVDVRASKAASRYFG